MAIRQKEKAGASTRSVEATCTASVRCEITAPGGHTIVTDEPADRGGENTGPSPLACLTASLASCQAVQIVKVAEAMRFAHGTITITASTTTDRVASDKGNDSEIYNNVFYNFGSSAIHSFQPMSLYNNIFYNPTPFF